MIELFLTVLALCALGLVRNQVAFRIEMHGLRLTSELAKAEIAAGHYDGWQRHYERLEQHSHEWLMFNLLVWTAEQAYPWLFDIEVLK